MVERRREDEEKPFAVDHCQDVAFLVVLSLSVLSA